MKCEKMIWIKRVGKNGTNTEGLKEKARVQTKPILLWVILNVVQNKATISTWRFIYIGGDKMMEKWCAIAFEYSSKKQFDGRSKKNSSCAKKRIVLCLGSNQSLWQKKLSFALEVTNLCDKQWNVNWHGLSKNNG